MPRFEPNADVLSRLNALSWEERCQLGVVELADQYELAILLTKGRDPRRTAYWSQQAGELERKLAKALDGECGSQPCMSATNRCKVG
jgi:hypothetical protein